MVWTKKNAMAMGMMAEEGWERKKGEGKVSDDAVRGKESQMNGRRDVENEWSRGALNR